MRRFAIVLLAATIVAGCSLSAARQAFVGFPTPHDFDTLAEIEKNPARWQGELVAFHGEVLWARDTPNGTLFQVYVEDHQHDTLGISLVALYPATRENTIAEGRTVDVLGYVDPTLAEGINAFGGPVSATRMAAIAVRVWDGGRYWLLKEQDNYEAWKQGHIFTRSL